MFLRSVPSASLAEVSVMQVWNSFCGCPIVPTTVGNASTSTFIRYMYDDGQKPVSVDTSTYAGRDPSALFTSFDGRPGTGMALWKPAVLVSGGALSNRERSCSF